MNIEHGGYGGIRNKLPLVPREAPPMPAVKSYRHPLDSFECTCNNECQPEFRSFELSISLAMWSLSLNCEPPSDLLFRVMSALRDENNA